MKIGIITIHYGVNYGSALQAYALTHFLRENNLDAEIIDFIPKRYRIDPYFACNKKNIFIKLIYILVKAPFLYFQRKVFFKFLKLNVPLSRKYKNAKELYKYASYDVYITGSDQVWNKDYNDDTQQLYYLCFAPKNSIKVSISASFGKSSIRNEEDLKQLYEGIKDFYAISVREDAGLEILNNIGIKNAVHLLDPTFLYNKESWVSHFNKKCLINEPYVLVYALDSEESTLINYAKVIASHKGYKVALISFDIRKRNKKNVDYYFHNKSPEYFINLFSNADFIVTNSFHGVAFSINFEKQFIAMSRKAYNSRLESILSLVNLQSRLMPRNNNFNINMAFREIDYDKVNHIIEEQRKKLIDFIIFNLKNKI